MNWRIGVVAMALIVLVGLGGALHAPSCHSQAGLTGQRPNVLLLIGDDHAPYVFGAYGNPTARTPNLDRLAAGGIRFERAYCNSPVCTPSRQSFITGKLPHTIGVTLLSTPLSDDQTTLADLLAAAGYETLAIGKMHFNSGLTHGFERHIDVDDFRQFRREHPPRPVPDDIAVLPPWRPFDDPARVWLNGFYRPYGAFDTDMAGTWFAQQAVNFLAQNHERPFFLVVSFYEPHSPFHFPVEYAGMYEPRRLEVPQPGPEDDWQIPAIFRDLTDTDKQGIIASYYTSAAFLDKNVGLVLDALERHGLADSTLVAYLSDHGYMLGQHGRFEKHCFYEPAVRSALVMRYPGRFPAGQVSDALVELIDVMPTVLDVCESPTPTDVQGRSLIPLITRKTDRHREFVFSEYLENEEAMIRTARWKYLYTTAHRERQDGYATGHPLPPRMQHRLYDLENDPDEMHNLANDPEYAAVLEQLRGWLYQRLVSTQKDPDLLPRDRSQQELIDWCLRPRD